MADDVGVGVFHTQVAQEVEHGFLLCLGAGVGGVAVGVETALIADADGIAVVVSGMCPADVLGERRHNVTVHSDIVMVGGLAEPSFACCYQRFCGERSVAARGTAMYYQELNVLAV